MMNPDVLAEVNYLEILVFGGKTIGFILWVLSFITVALAIRYFLQIRRLNILPKTVRDDVGSLFESKKYREAIDLTENQPDFLSYLIHASLTEAPHGYPSMERAMEEAAEEKTTQMFRSIEWLNLIGNIGPMLGLLGTVWGMIGAFFKIVESGQRFKIFKMVPK